MVPVPLRPVHHRLAPALERLLSSSYEERRIGPFWLIKQLGRGSFAPVWLARETYGTTFVRMAAVKLFALGSVGSKGQDRIAREARALCQVEHPHVVRFYALPIDEDAGVGGLAMEHVPGSSLEQRIRAEGSIPAAEVLRIGIAMASALDAVHRAGLVHRDLKPDNVVESDGVYKLIDFGIAQGDVAREEDDKHGYEEIGDEQGTQRLSHGPSGTAGFVDPACFDGETASPASDLYALGATLYTCLMGAPPAVRGVRGPLRFDDVVPVPLASLITELLATERAKRPSSAAEVERRLGVLRLEKIEAEAKQIAGVVEGRRRRRVLGTMALLLVGFGCVGIGWRRAGVEEEPISPVDEYLKPRSQTIAQGTNEEPQNADLPKLSPPPATSKPKSPPKVHSVPLKTRPAKAPTQPPVAQADPKKPPRRKLDIDAFTPEKEWR